MKLCPTCSNVALTPVQRSGVELDYCSTCRGVWLDRGELEKILQAEAVSTMHASAPPIPGEYRPDSRDSVRRDDRRDDDDDRRRSYDDDDYYSKKKKRKGIFSEIFDFD